jgi:hypothetical protein
MEKNKNCYLAPEQDIIDFIKNQENQNLANQIENIGFMINLQLPVAEDVNELWSSKETQEDLMHMWGNIRYISDYLRSLAFTKCDPPLKYALQLPNSNGKIIVTDTNGETSVIDNE